MGGRPAGRPFFVGTEELRGAGILHMAGLPPHIEDMKHTSHITGLLLAASLALTPALAPAQDAPDENPDLAEGAEKLSEGFRQLFQGLMLEGQEGWDKLGDWLDDMNAYEPPERLPNGDIIIRRKVPLEAPAGETDI